MSEAFDRGITVTEMTSMDEPVDVRTHCAAAFVGRALRGPLNTPVTVRSLGEFFRRFGGIWPRSGLGPAVEQFFMHGGRRLHVVRVANGASGSIIRLPGENGVLTLTAVEPGSAEIIRASVDYDRIAAGDIEHFNLTIQRIAPKRALVIDQEIHERLSCREDSRRYVAEVLGNSDIVRTIGPAPGGRPDATVGPHVDRVSGYVLPAERGSDGDALSDYDVIGSAREQTGIFALNGVEAFDLLYLPPNGRAHDYGPAAVAAAELYCRKRGAMLILDPPGAWSSVDDAIRGARSSDYDSPNILSYFPRVVVSGDPSPGPRPAGAALAGLLSKLDDNAGPWCDLDSAGYALKSHLQPAIRLDGEAAARLVREGLNVIDGATAGRAAFRGSVTMARRSRHDARSASLTVRRLCLHVCNTIGRATRWAVFQAGGPRVAHLVRAQVHAFMVGLANEGAFADPRFDVHCEAGLHIDPHDPLRGVTIIVSFVPVGASDKVWLTLHQTVQGCRVSPSAFTPVREECA